MAVRFVRRTLAATVCELSERFGAVLLTGPRQVGKTTLFRHIQRGARNYVTLDDPQDRALAQTDPAAFLQRYEPPVLIDEVQYAPQLFPYVKMSIDKLGKPGLFWLTGSQQFEMMKHVSESLAGRVAIVKLLGFSMFEEAGKAQLVEPFLPKLQRLQNRQQAVTPLSLMQVYQRIWRGAFPFVALNRLEDCQQFYQSYVATYMQRDVRDYARIHNESVFLKFLQLAAAHSGQLVNYAHWARDLSVSQPTVKAWLTVLQACGLVYLLQPFETNLSKRVLKTPKLYFLDTGLCCYLAGWSSPQVLERGAMSGAILETYVVSEIIKSYWHNGKEPRVFFYRDKQKREVDVILEENGTIYPVAIKKTATPSKQHAQHFAALQQLNVSVGCGAVVCFRANYLPLTSDVYAVCAGCL